MEVQEVTDSDLLEMLENVTNQWIEENNQEFLGSTAQNEHLQVEELHDITDMQQVSLHRNIKYVIKMI